MLIAMPFTGILGLISPTVCALLMFAVSDVVTKARPSSIVKAHQVGLAYISLKIFVVIVALTVITLSFSLSKGYSQIDKIHTDKLILFVSIMFSAYFYVVIIKNYIRFLRKKEFKGKLNVPLTYKQWRNNRGGKQ